MNFIPGKHMLISITCVQRLLNLVCNAERMKTLKAAVNVKLAYDRHQSYQNFTVGYSHFL